MAKSFSRQKSRHAPQKEGGLKILCDPGWYVQRTLCPEWMGRKHTHTHTKCLGQQPPPGLLLVAAAIALPCHIWLCSPFGDVGDVSSNSQSDRRLTSNNQSSLKRELRVVPRPLESRRQPHGNSRSTWAFVTTAIKARNTWHTTHFTCTICLLIVFCTASCGAPRSPSTSRETRAPWTSRRPTGSRRWRGIPTRMYETLVADVDALGNPWRPKTHIIIRSFPLPISFVRSIIALPPQSDALMYPPGGPQKI